MISIWRQISRTFTSPSPASIPAFVPPSYRFFSTSSPYVVKVGIPEFLNGIGKGVEAHVGKLESEFGDLQKLLVVRTLKLKKLEIPCKHFPCWFIVLISSIIGSNVVYNFREAWPEEEREIARGGRREDLNLTPRTMCQTVSRPPRPLRITLRLFRVWVTLRYQIRLLNMRICHSPRAQSSQSTHEGI
uniref:Small ribosomal subunit protein mS41 SAM domain-containing protein n=1 Tax=Chenopodium quinoa TaxID=63459 RepID=A0A803KN10_CHEQI